MAFNLAFKIFFGLFRFLGGLWCLRSLLMFISHKSVRNIMSKHLMARFFILALCGLVYHTVIANWYLLWGFSITNWTRFCPIFNTHPPHMERHGHFRSSARLAMVFSTWSFHSPPRYPWWTFMDIWLITHPLFLSTWLLKYQSRPKPVYISNPYSDKFSKLKRTP